MVESQRDGRLDEPDGRAHVVASPIEGVGVDLLPRGELLESVGELYLTPRAAGCTLEFLEDGSKVKVVVMFRGREMAHIELGQKIVERLLDDLKDVALLDDDPRLEGRNLSLMISPRKV